MQFDQLKRRAFITLLGGAAAAWPLAARGQRYLDQIFYSRSQCRYSDLIGAFPRCVRRSFLA
jgi:hypothetical protein